MGTSFLEKPERYEKEVIRYKKKYIRHRCDISQYLIKCKLQKKRYSISDLPSLLQDNSSQLQDLVLSIVKSIPSVRGTVSSVAYSSVIGELLDTCDMEYEIHVGFVLPVIINDTSAYNYSVVNYMYISSNEGVEYHYFNGKTDSSLFTFIKEDTVEV